MKLVEFSEKRLCVKYNDCSFNLNLMRFKSFTELCRIGNLIRLFVQFDTLIFCFKLSRHSHWHLEIIFECGNNWIWIGEKFLLINFVSSSCFEKLQRKYYRAFSVTSIHKCLAQVISIPNKILKKYFLFVHVYISINYKITSLASLSP